MPMQFDQLHVVEAGEVNLCRLVGGLPFKTVDATITAVPAFGVRVVAMLLVIPVDDVNRAVGAILQIYCHIFRIAAEELVAPGMDRVEPGTAAPVHLLVDLVPSEVVREEVAAK